MGDVRTPNELRQQIRSGIVDALERDAELRGPRTARLLIAAGALGVFAAFGMIRMLSGHPYDHHPGWHVVFFTSLWSGLLVVMLAIALLQVRTPSMALARSARLGVLALGIAGLCSAFCPDQHFLEWWSSTAPGSRLSTLGGLVLSALCFGLVTTFVFGASAAILGMEWRRRRPLRPLLPAAILLLLLLPGVALQSVGTSWGVFSSWLLGTGSGGYAGFALGIWLRVRRARTGE